VKFLCVPCDKPMVLEGKSSDRGSISLTYACPDCGYEMAMLTNPMETQIVGSLGVRIGPEGAEGQGASKCPFTGVVREMDAAGAPAPSIPWTPQAEARMRNLPEFVRPMVLAGIERFARERGHPEVDEGVIEEAKRFLGME
jgi:hypothetical protein